MYANDAQFQRHHLICESIEELCSALGLADSLAHLYAVVFASPEQPVRLTEAARRAGVAKSTASVGLRKLEALGLLRKRAAGSDRQDSYEPNPDALESLFAQLHAWLIPAVTQIGHLQRLLDAQADERELPVAQRRALKQRGHEISEAHQLATSLLAAASARAVASRAPRPAHVATPVPTRTDLPVANHRPSMVMV